MPGAPAHSLRVTTAVVSWTVVTSWCDPCTRFVPEATEKAIAICWLMDAAVGNFVVIAVDSREVCVVMVQKSSSLVMTGVFAGVSAVVTQQQTILVICRRHYE